MNRDRIQEWLTEKVAALLGVNVADVDPSQSFSWLGLDSMALVPLAAEAEQWLKHPLSPTLLFEYPTIAELAAFLERASAIEVAEAWAAGPVGDLRSEAIAIIGMGCDFPGARGPQAFWRLLIDGTDAVREVPRDRWNADDYYDPDQAAPGKSVTRWGGFVEKVAHFDPSFFGISSREATRMDPQQRLLLEVAWEAIEDAGIIPDTLAGLDVGVYVGISHHEYSAHVFTDPTVIDGYSASGNALSIAANRVSYCFDFRGPSVAIDTACSSSLYAVWMACEAIRSGQVPMALAGASNLIFWPGSFVALSKAGIMARDGRCKAFDARADGYVRGEGVGLVLLKPLSQARADGDHVYAVIRGTAVTQDGRTNGLMAPNARAQEAVLRKAYQQAGVDPSEVDYVETHGTGTFLGDAIEAKALGAVVGAKRAPGSPCRIGSVKTNIGHLEPAAGIAGMIKVALSLERGLIPKSLHFETPNGEIPFAELGIAVQTELEAYPRRDRAALAGVSSFGFGGANAHTVLEAILRGERADVEVPLARPLILPLSARSPDSLRLLAKSYLDLIGDPGGPPLADICGTAGRYRQVHKHRFATVGTTREDFVEQLEAFASDRVAPKSSTGTATDRPRVAFVFSGQGSQWAGMARGLQLDPVFRQAFRTCCAAIAAASGVDLVEELARDASSSRLDETFIAQPAIFAVQVGLTHLWRSWGVQPDAVVGHSSGEIAAAHVAGILTLEDAARLVAERASAMECGRGKGKMLSVHAPLQQVQALLAGIEEGASIAAINGPRGVVVAGTSGAIEALAGALEARGLGFSPLRVDYAFHSPLMADAGPTLARALGFLEPRAAGIKMVSTVTGEPIDGASLDAAYWGRNVTQPVLLRRAVEQLLRNKTDVFLEIGPHPVLFRDIEETLRYSGETGTVSWSLKRELEAMDAMLRSAARLFVGGVSLNWAELYPRDVRRVSVPSHPWHHERLWIDVAEAEAAPAARGTHKLLGDHVALVHVADAHVWHNSISAGGGLTDRAAATPLFDAACLVEMMLSAGRQMGLGSRVVVSDVELKAPLVAAPRETFALYTHALPQWAGKWSCSVLRRPAGDPTSSWETCVTGGILTADDAPDEDPEVLADAQQRCSRSVVVDTFYDAFLDEGEAPAGFRVVRGLWASDDEVVAQLTVPEVLKKDGDYAVHPVIIAACLQLFAAGTALCGAASSSSQSVLQPHSIRRVALHRPAPTSLWARLRMKRSTSGASLEVFDEAGALVLEMSGLEAKARAAHLPAAASRLHFYETRWDKTPSAPPGAPAESGRWLIFGDRGGTGWKLAAALQEQGQACLVIPHPDKEEAPVESDSPMARLDRSSPEPVASAIRDRFGPGSPSFRGIVHLWSLDAPPLDALDDASLRQVEHDGCSTVLTLLQSLCASGASSLPRLWIVTRGAQPVLPPADGAPPLQPAQSSVWGLTKGVEFELPELCPTLVDLDPASGDVDDFVRELLHGEYRGAPAESDSEDFERPNQIAFRNAGRYVATTALTTRSPTSERLPLHENATYVVTGGLGGIGMKVASWMVERGAKHLVLTSRRPADRETEASIERLRGQGTTILVRSCDVAVREQVDELLGEIRATMPPLRGVMHAAGVLDDGALLDLTPARLAAVLAPKVLGSVHWHAATLGDSLDFFVLFSSVASLVGNPGQGAYNAANMFLDVLAHERRARGLPALSVSWGPWAEVGLVARGLQQVDGPRRGPKNTTYLLAPAECMNVLESLLLDGSTYVCVLPGTVKHLFGLWKRRSDASRLQDRPNLKQAYIAPRNDVERQIATCWARLLAFKSLGIRDNFFELGGDSVLAGRVLTFVNRTYGVSLSLREAFESFTIESLAKQVDAQLVAKVDQLSEADALQLLAAGESAEE